MPSTTLALAPLVREVEIPGCPPEDYRAAVLWCPECAVEPWTTVKCSSCSDVHREANFGPYLTCNRCGSDLVWAVITTPTQRHARFVPTVVSGRHFADGET